MYYISEERAKQELLEGNLSYVEKLSSVEDIATIIETFELVLKEVSSSSISGVMENSTGNYIFVLSETDDDTGFDFYQFVNDMYKGNLVVNCVNAKLMFPRGKSRGICVSNGFDDDIEESTGEVDGEATGYMDEEELDDIVNGRTLKLLYSRLGIKITIDSNGVILGRSSKQADYVIHGNTNVSRLHAKVYKMGNSYFVHNYEPPNGTFIDGVRVKNFDDVELAEGSILMLADEEFRLE